MFFTANYAKCSQSRKCRHLNDIVYTCICVCLNYLLYAETKTAKSCFVCILFNVYVFAVTDYNYVFDMYTKFFLFYLFLFESIANVDLDRYNVIMMTRQTRINQLCGGCWCSRLCRNFYSSCQSPNGKFSVMVEW